MLLIWGCINELRAISYSSAGLAIRFLGSGLGFPCSCLAGGGLACCCPLASSAAMADSLFVNAIILSSSRCNTVSVQYMNSILALDELTIP